MEELVRKSLLFGLGIATMTQQKVEKMVNDFAKKNNINKSEAKRLVNAMMKHSKDTQKKFLKDLNKELDKIIKEKSKKSKKKTVKKKSKKKKK